MTTTSCIQAQNNPCRSKDLPVLVRDTHSLPIDGLVPEDFSAKTKGQPIRVVSATPGPRPRRVVMLLDTSGSMQGIQGSGQWKLALEIVNQFARALSPHSQLAFLTFDETVHDTIDFSAGNPAVLAQLRRMLDGNGFSSKNVRGRTALFDAVHSGLQLIQNASVGDILFVVTDGGDNKSRVKREDLERELVRSGVGFYAVLIMDAQSGGRGRTPEELSGPDILYEVADTTGGEVFGPVGYRTGHYVYFGSPKYNFDDKMKTEQALMLFYEGLFHHETLSLELPVAISKKERWLELRLSESAKRKWKGAVISYPQKLLPCEAKVD